LATKLELLYQIITPAVEALDLELWGIEFQGQGKQTMLRLYIDSPDGIGVDDCARVSHQVSGVLDVEDPIKSEFTLEVSSPGVDRPLFKLDQYGKNVGSVISVRLNVAYEGRRKYQGVLTAVENDEILMIVDDHEYAFPLEMIDKAHVVARLGIK
jgi:ribosome maturation factor RimP